MKFNLAFILSVRQEIASRVKVRRQKRGCFSITPVGNLYRDDKNALRAWLGLMLGMWGGCKELSLDAFSCGSRRGNRAHGGFPGVPRQW